MIHAVRCPHCQNLSRVASEVIGRAVACPHCRQSFTAAADPMFAPAIPAKPRIARRVPTASPALRAPVLARVLHDGHDDPGPPPMLLGLALLPIGIPLLWLAARVITGEAPVFSYAAPVAIAIGLSALAIGVVFAHGMSVGTKLKAILAIALVGYMLGGFVFFMKKEWAERVRKNLGGPNELEWREFSPPNKAYSVKVPWQETAADGQLPGWSLEGYRFSNPAKNRNDGLDIAYEIAAGAPPADLGGKALPDDEWFRAARKAVVEKCDGQVTAEKSISHEGHPGREFTLSLPDGATNKIVRVFRVRDRAYYLAVEGVFVPVDAKFVGKFFDSLQIEPKKK